MEFIPAFYEEPNDGDEGTRRNGETARRKEMSELITLSCALDFIGPSVCRLRPHQFQNGEREIHPLVWRARFITQRARLYIALCRDDRFASRAGRRAAITSRHGSRGDPARAPLRAITADRYRFLRRRRRLY